MTHRRIVALLAGLAGTLPASAPAAAQEARSALETLTPRQVEAAARYALPIAIEGAMNACEASLDPDGFLAREGDALRIRASEGSAEAWPEARDALFQLASEQAEVGGEIPGDLLASLPDESLRPFVSGMILLLVEEELKPKDCANVERGLELLAPLPPGNMAGLIGFIYELVQEDDARERAQARSTGENRRLDDGVIDAREKSAE